MSFHSGEFAWNSVDVRGADGLLHSGHVVDVMNKGLIIDFGGARQSGLQQIPFGQAYHRHYSDYFEKVSRRIDAGVETANEQRSVEVLLRLRPEEPWKWYPGLLLQSFGLVSVTLPDYELKGFCVQQRVRERSTDEKLNSLRVKKGRFTRTMIAVPSRVRVPVWSDEQMIAKFNEGCLQENHWMMATQVLNAARHSASKGLMVMALTKVKSDLYTVAWPNYYHLEDSYCFPKPLEELALSVLNQELKRRALEEEIAIFSPELELPRYDDCDIRPTRKRGRDPSPLRIDFDGRIQTLYRDPTIFPQIFDCLSTLQQTRLRIVCRRFDVILTSPYIRRVLTVSASEHGLDYDYRQYEFASCLYHAWSQQTRVVVLYGGTGRTKGPLADTTRLLAYILKAKGLPDVERVLLTKQWKLYDRVFDPVKDVYDALTSLAAVCQWVSLKKAEIFVQLEPLPSDNASDDGLSDDGYRREKEDIAVRFCNQLITRQPTAKDCWTMLNKGVGELSMEDVNRLAESITGLTDREPREIIFLILNMFQSLDPRDGVRHRGASFSAEEGATGLDGIDVPYLTKLTLHALHRHRKGQRLWHGYTGPLTTVEIDRVVW